MLNALLPAKTPPIFRTLYPECLWKVDTRKKVLYLTFDDGPIPEVTPFVLDELKKYKAKATFFCIGKNIEASPAIFERIVREGHATGNHTYDHLNGWKYTNEKYFENIEKCNDVLREHLSKYTAFRAPFLFRPPYGKLKLSQYQLIKTKYRVVMWDVLTFDFNLKTRKETVLKTALKYSGPGSLIVFHDSLKAKPKVEFALPEVLKHFSSKGFKFEKL